MTRFGLAAVFVAIAVVAPLWLPAHGADVSHAAFARHTLPVNQARLRDAASRDEHSHWLGRAFPFARRAVPFTPGRLAPATADDGAATAGRRHHVLGANSNGSNDQSWHTRALACTTDAVHVSASGIDRLSCGAASAPCRTLRAALSTPLPPHCGDDTARRVIVASGLYDHDSCGIVTGGPVAIIGNGSSSTVVDCHRRDRFLAATGAVVTLIGFTVVNSFVNCTQGRGDTTVEDACSGGGGAVTVNWGGPHTLLQYSALLRDIAFGDNAVVASAVSTGGDDDSGAPGGVTAVGGGAVAIAFTGPVGTILPSVTSVTVSVLNCSFHGNAVTVPSQSFGGGGGGVFVSITPLNAPVGSVAVTVQQVVADGNSAGEGDPGTPLDQGRVVRYMH